MKKKIEYVIYPCNKMALYLVTVATFCVLLMMAGAIECFGQVPKTELQLQSKYNRVCYQNNHNSWTAWDTTKSPVMLGIFPEHQLFVIDDGSTDFYSKEGQNSIYSISTRDNINCKWYSGMDASGKPLTIKIVHNKDLTYNIELRYENYFDKNTGRQIIVGKATEYLNCKIKTL